MHLAGIALENTVTAPHHPGTMNPRWPLCWEVEAASRGWTRAEIIDGEPAFENLYIITGEAFHRLDPDSQCRACSTAAYC